MERCDPGMQEAGSHGLPCILVQGENFTEVVVLLGHLSEIRECS